MNQFFDKPENSLSFINYNRGGQDVMCINDAKTHGLAPLLTVRCFFDAKNHRANEEIIWRKI